MGFNSGFKGLTRRSSRIPMPRCTVSLLSCPRSRHPLPHQACIPRAIPWYLPCLGTLYNDLDAGWATGFRFPGKAEIVLITPFVQDPGLHTLQFTGFWEPFPGIKLPNFK